MDKRYTQEQLVRVAKRENNKKRGYLVVNPLQGKHVPVAPSLAMNMIKDLGRLVKQAYPKERLLAVGFAETATAIGAGVASVLDCYYMQTTREEIEGVTFLHFSEVHSHATSQKVVREDISSIVGEIDRIVFVEDEVTTGNTILNIVNIIQKEFGENIRFAVASLLNGMNEQARLNYENRGIDIHYLVKTNHENYEEIAGQYKEDGEYRTNSSLQSMGVDETDFKKILVFHALGYENARRLVRADDYEKSCAGLLEQVSGLVPEECKDILVLGTEEFMYPPLYVARGLEEQGKKVSFHATTRSPIAVSRQKDYVLHTRYQLTSLYEKERTTFVYNLRKYDDVLVITDASVSSDSSSQGMAELIGALREAGNEKVQFVSWNS